jgi:hypothetical protein
VGTGVGTPLAEPGRMRTVPVRRAAQPVIQRRDQYTSTLHESGELTLGQHSASTSQFPRDVRDYDLSMSEKKEVCLRV